METKDQAGRVEEKQRKGKGDWAVGKIK